ncbi:MAG: DNA translocase FtsK 4TM domain-containing protein, partial [Acidimicrobiales bacterium]
MATTNRRPAPARKRPSSTARKRTASKGRSGSARSKKGVAREGTWSRLAPALRRGDTWGAVLLVVAVLVGLGVWLDAAGPVGRGIGDAVAAAVGLTKVVAPLLLAAAAVLLLRGPREDGAPSSRPVIGVTVVLLSVCGLAHLAVEPPAGSLTALRGAGGLAGLGIAGPLRALLATAGATVVLTVLLGTGLLVITRTSARAAAGHAAAGARPVAGAVRRGVRWLGTLSPAPGGEDDDEGPKPFDDAEAAVTVLDGSEDETSAGTDTTAVRPPLQSNLPAPVADVDPEQLAIDLGPGVAPGAWKLPTLGLLKRSEAQEIDQRLVEEGGRTLEMALAAHGVETRLIGYTVGPTVTRYELELGPGVKVVRVTSLHKDIAYAMASPDVRILAPIPGRSAIGVEVPNKDRQLVALGDILASEEARRAKHPCAVAMGIDIAGRAVMANLAEMPHILIAGATGAGKSSCINSLITSILVRSTPEQCRLILIDPKRVELGQYNDLPHLLTSVVVNPKKAANALSWAVKEMERRYDLLSEVGVRDITGYNAAFDRGDLRTEPRAEGVDDPGETIYKRLSFIVIVVDELNDL